MAFPTKDTFTFDFEAQSDYPNWTPAQTKEYMNARGEELRVALNAVANLLNATTSDASGADNTGIPETIAGSGTNVRDRTDWLYAQIVAAVLGAIPDGSLSTIKYADGSVTAAKVAADVATQAELDDLAGVGRTTETVKGNADSLAIHQADYAHHYAVDAGSTDDYAITPDPAITAYVAGQIFQVLCPTANTGACTLNVNSRGAKAIKKNVVTDLVTGDIVAGQIISVIYDGTNFQIVSNLPVDISLKASIVSGSYTGNATGGRTISVGFTPKLVIITEQTDTRNEWTITNATYAVVHENFSGYHEVTTNVKLTTGGFIVGTTDYANASGKTYYYVAMG